MKYYLELRIEPENHFLHVSGKIEDAESSRFYLNENFTLLHAESEGSEIAVTMEKDQPHPAFDSVSRPIVFDTAATEISFEYEGFLPERIADVNQIDADVVELASYSGWYPKPKELDTLFDFEVELHLPAGYEIASNGRCEEDGRIVSTAREFDIVIFASRLVKRFTYEAGAVKCSFLCPPDLLPQMESRAEDILWANRFFTEKYGALSGQGGASEIVSVFRPNGGWGYKRGNASFVSAEWGRKEKQYQGDFHELAHGWWSIANVRTNDWINEGGAEFSAFSAARARYGEEYGKQQVKKYLEEIESSDSETSIVEVGPDSPDRYLNHYFKTTVMYLLAQKRFGEERLFGLLRQVFQTYQNTQEATTEGFLALCDAEMKPFFEECLFARDWKTLIENIQSF